MEERQVTVDTVTYQLGSPFMVIATQNPIEHEGTYPLPEAQLDRFMMRLSLGYPSVESETAILATHGVASLLDEIEPVTDAPGIADLIASADAAMSGRTSESILAELLNEVPVPVRGKA